jgi:hypothetical protein
MDYIIVENKTVVLLGPISWKQRFIQSEFNSLEIPYIVPPAEQGYINVDQVIGNGSATGIEIFPITTVIKPDIDPNHQQYAGPFYTYFNNAATMAYEVLDNNIDSIKGKLKDRAAEQRWIKQNSGTIVTINSVDIPISTDIASLHFWNSIASNIGTGSINYKTSSGFISLGLSDVTTIMQAIHDFIQQQFNWEQDIWNQIDAATNSGELKSIQIMPVSQKPQSPPIL